MVIEWSEYVNKLIRKNGTSWQDINIVIEDTTLSGRTKRRLSGSNSKKLFNVTMNFSLEEYRHFKDWYKNACCNGFYSFYFPQIDDVVTNNYETKVYRFPAGSVPQFSNPSGNRIECTMTWEEVSE